MSSTWAKKISAPVKDKSQNYEVLGGYQNETHTVVRFKRPWTTGDKEDFPLGSDTVRVIWAFHEEDPKPLPLLYLADDERLAEFQQSRRLYHGSNRGSRSVLLREKSAEIRSDFASDVKTWDLKADNHLLPGERHTLYYCQVFKAPEEAIDNKHHIVGFEPIIQKGHEGIVHHMVLFECHFPPEVVAQNVNSAMDAQAEARHGEECRTPNMPLHWNYCVFNAAFAWAIGSEGLHMPEKAGFPIGSKHGGATYYILETHYDNAKMRDDIVDNSGMRFFYTDNLREHDIGLLTVGSVVTGPRQLIPPGQKEFKTVGVCSQECSQHIPENGVTLANGFLHAHLLGRKLKLRHIRDGKEIRTIFEDNYYDFNFQVSREIKDKKLMPNDELIMECDYDSSARKNITTGGESTRHEMCLAFILYYPRSRVNWCSSGPNWQTYTSSLQLDVPKVLKKLAEGKNLGSTSNLNQFIAQLAVHAKKGTLKFSDIFAASLDQINEIDWSDPEFVKAVETGFNHGTHDQICVLDRQLNILQSEYPDFTPLRN